MQIDFQLEIHLQIRPQIHKHGHKYTNKATNTQIRREIQSDAKWAVGHLLFIQWMLLIKPLTNDEHGGRLERDG